MHFEAIPPYLQNLTTLEAALISRISVAINVHILRYGMLAYKGHCVSLPQEMQIATQLPLLPQEVGIVVLKRKGSNEALRQYTVKRKTVEDALKGLCFGYPHGGTTLPHPGYVQYNGPNHICKDLNGRFFEYLPNCFYKDVKIEEDRLLNIPVSRDELPGLQVIEVPNMSPEEDKGPAEKQAEIDCNKDDESITVSGVACPVEPVDTHNELVMILKKFCGKGMGAKALREGSVATADWKYTKGQP